MTTKRKNIMRAFRINEISAVDRPSMEHARMNIMKRAAPEQEYDEMQKIIERPRSFATLSDAMKAIQEDQKCSQHEAMSAAAREHPALLEKYNREGDEKIAKAADLTIMRKPPAVQQFEDLIRSIKQRDGCDSLTALRRAQAADPALFREYQAA